MPRRLLPLLLALVTALLLLVGGGCHSFDRETEIKKRSVAALEDQHRIRLDALLPGALKRCVKIKPSIGKVGSGCVISADGWIATAEHVIRGEADVDVVLWDGVTLPARVMAAAFGNDYALLKVEAENLPYYELGSRPSIGQPVVAIGTAYRRGPDDRETTVSAGRCIYPFVCIPGEVGTYYYNAVFHSAPIFPGDSGGALLDLEGRLVGVHGGFAADNASVAPSIDQIRKLIRTADGRVDPAAAVRGHIVPVRWPATRPQSFEESTEWTVRSVRDTLIAIYAPEPGGDAYVDGVLESVRQSYLELRATDQRPDDALVRAMLGDVFQVLQQRKKGGKPAPVGAAAGAH